MIRKLATAFLAFTLLASAVLWKFEASGQTGQTNGQVSFVPTSWDTQWLPQTTGTIRCYLGNFGGGRLASQITPTGIKLNNSLSLYQGITRVRPSMSGFTGEVLECSFFRPDAFATLGWVVPGRSYPVTVTGKFQDNTPFSCVVQILIAGVPLIDDTAPVITVTGVVANECTASNVIPIVSASDRYLKDVTITLDGQPFNSGTTVTGEGSHLFQVSASDQAGNIATKDIAFNIDRTDPVITVSGVNAGECGSADVIPVVQVTDSCLNSSTITLDGQVYISGTVITVEGSHALHVAATDKAGHNASADIAFIIDRTAPAAGSNLTDGQVSTTPLEVRAQCNDANPANSTITIDGQVVQDGVMISSLGSHTVVITCTDCAGNSNDKQLTVTIQGQQIDNDIPGIFILTPEISSKTNNPTPTITIKYKDQESGINQSSLTATLNGQAIGSQFSLTAEGGSYQPSQPLANGPYSLVVSVQDNAGNSNSASCAFEVDVARPAETPLTGFIEGFVFNTNGETPLEGALVTGRDAQLNALPGQILTDLHGHFSYPTPAAGVYCIDISKPGFTYAQRKANVETDKPVGVEPVYLMPMDPVVTTITPSGGTHTDSRQLVQIDFPSGAVDHPIDVSVTPIDSFRQLPADLPENSVFTYCFELEPHGQVFNIPLTIRVKNTLGFAVGDSIPVGFFSPELGQWQNLTMAYVQPGGEWIEYQANRFSWHDVNAAPPPKPEGPNEDEDKTPDDEDQCREEGQCGSKYSYRSGDLSHYISLPPVKVIGNWEGVSFSYNSNTTRPTFLADLQMNLRSVATATLTRMELNVAGVHSEHVFSWQNTSARFAEEREIKSDDSTWLESGSFPYEMKVTNEFANQVYWSARCFGCGPIDPLRAYTRQTTPSPFVKKGRAAILNERTSSFGGGWGLDGLYKIAGTPADSFVLLFESSNKLIHFYKDNSGTKFSNKAHDDMYLFVASDGNFRLKSASSGTVIEFDITGRMTNVTYTSNLVYRYFYNLDGNPVRIEDPLKRKIFFEYSNSRRLKKVTDQVGRVTEFDINANNELTGITYPDGSSEHFSYDDQLMTSYTNQNNKTTNYQYSENRLSRVIGPTCCGGREMTLSPSSSKGLANFLQNGEGTDNQPATLISTQNDLLTSSYPDKTTRFSTNKYGQVTSEITPLGTTTTTTYSESARPLQVVSEDGGVTRLEYSSSGQILSVIDPTNAESHFTYTTTNNYGMPVVQTSQDPKGAVTTYGSNQFGLITSITDAQGKTSHYDYNSVGLVTRMRDKENKETKYEYDSLFNLIAVQLPGLETMTMTYDEVGNQLTQTDGRGFVTSYSYDAMGRVQRVTSPGDLSTNYDYDSRGNLLTIVGPNGDALSYTYDGSNRLLTSTDPLGQTTTYNYDLDGNLISKTTAEGELIEFRYDANDRLIKKSMQLDTTRYAYDAVGRVTEIANLNSVNTFEYNRRGELISANGLRKSRLQYLYDKAGNLSESRLALAGGYQAVTIDNLPGNPKRLTAGDFNGDQAIDVANIFGDSLRVSFNNGSNQYTTGVSYFAGVNAAALKAVDIDQDGDVDIIVICDDGLKLFVNDGQGTFSSQSITAVPNMNKAFDLDFADINKDGIKDIVVFGRLAISDAHLNNQPAVFVMSGSGAGSFSFLQYSLLAEYYVDNGCCPTQGNIVCSDLDLDGDMDVVITTHLSGGFYKPDGHYAYNWDLIAVFPNDNGHLLASDLYQTKQFKHTPNSLAVADMTGDGYPDLIVTQTRGTNWKGGIPYEGHILILPNRATNAGPVPQFTFPFQYVGIANEDRVAAFDFDNDGWNDVVGLAKDCGTLVVYKNTGNGVLSKPELYSAGSGAVDFVPVDLNNDGFRDFVVLQAGTSLSYPPITPGGLSTLLNNWGAGISGSRAYYFSAVTNRWLYPEDTVSTSAAGRIKALTLNDFNGDGLRDVVACSFVDDQFVSGTSVVFSLNNSATPGSLLQPYARFGGSVVGVTSADFDSDGDQDVAVLDYQRITIGKNDGHGVFSFSSLAISLPYYVANIVSGDIDGDGKIDIVTAGGASCYFLKNDGLAGFVVASTIVPGLPSDAFDALDLLDIDDDGDLDLVATCIASRKLSIFTNSGLGVFTFAGSLPTTLYPDHVTHGDLNGDDLLDLIVSYRDNTSSTSANINIASVFRNIGGGSFAPRQDIALGYKIVDVQADDFDGDGDQDLIAADLYKGIVIARNNGNMNFAVSQVLTGVSKNNRLAIADMDNDGLNDIVVGSNGSPVVAIILNGTGSTGSLSIERSYDELNRLKTMKYAEEGQQRFATTFDYDNVGRIQSLLYENGIRTQFSYDTNNRLAAITNARLGIGLGADVSYTYDNNGNRQTMTDRFGLHQFGYDERNQLTTVTHPSLSLPDENYAYDNLDNRVTSHLSNLHTVNAANQLLEDQQFRYQYDRKGNVVHRVRKANLEVTDYRYDADNKLLAILTLPGGGAVTDSVLYKYDGLGRRIEKNVTGKITRYVYDGLEILMELDSANGVKATYIDGPGIDNHLAVKRDGQFYYYLKDGIGSTLKLVDSVGQVAKEYAYDAFGNIKTETGGVQNSFTFTGREFDQESQLYYFRARMYNSQTGRFLETDPIGAAGGLNQHIYVANNPLVLTDPMGLSPQCEISNPHHHLPGDFIQQGDWPDDKNGNAILWPIIAPISVNAAGAVAIGAAIGAAIAAEAATDLAAANAAIRVWAPRIVGYINDVVGPSAPGSLTGGALAAGKMISDNLPPRPVPDYVPPATPTPIPSPAPGPAPTPGTNPCGK